MKIAKKIAIAMALLGAAMLLGQAAAQFAMTTPSGAVSGCPTPTTGTNILCSVTDGYYVSVSGAAYAKINAAAGVASFNGRTGNVMPVQNDYSLSQLSGQLTAAQLPNTMTCSMTAQVGGTDTITLSNCK